MIGEIFPAKHSALKVLVNVDEIEFNVKMHNQETPGGGASLGIIGVSFVPLKTWKS